MFAERSSSSSLLNKIKIPPEVVRDGRLRASSLNSRRVGERHVTVFSHSSQGDGEDGGEGRSGEAEVCGNEAEEEEESEGVTAIRREEL